MGNDQSPQKEEVKEAEKNDDRTWALKSAMPKPALHLHFEAVRGQNFGGGGGGQFFFHLYLPESYSI